MKISKTDLPAMVKAVLPPEKLSAGKREAALSSMSNELDDLAAMYRKRRVSPGRSPVLRKWAIATAVMGCMAAVWIGLRSGRGAVHEGEQLSAAPVVPVKDSPTERWVYSEGQEVIEHLESGTLKLLGPGKLRIDTAESGTSIHLFRGTLLAEIPPSKTRPEISVVTDTATVRVTGTIFLVHADAGSFRAGVSRGSVAVDHDGVTIHLIAGQYWAPDSVQALTAEDIERLATMVPIAVATAPTDTQPAPMDRTVSLSPGPAAPATAPPEDGSARASGPRERQRPVRESPAETKPLDANSADPNRVPQAQPLRDEAEAPPEEVVEPAAAPSSTGGPSSTAAPSSAAALYSSAEDALQRGKSDIARLTWRQLITAYPKDPLAALALYDLARLSFLNRRYDDALSNLDELAQHQGGDGRAEDGDRLGEAAHWLRCQVHGQQASTLYRSCLSRFLAEYPNSPRRDEIEKRLTP